MLRVLAALAASGALPGHAAERPGLAWLGATAAADGRFHFSGIGPDGAKVVDLDLPGRGHGVALHPRMPVCILFARRPGTFALAVDWRAGEIVSRIDSRPDRHFYGHGTFSPDGRTLFATENDFEGAAGVIGVYDATDRYRRIGELPSHGVGPHDLRLLADARTLVVANGGIQTHPDAGRAKLNLQSMRPSLAYVDVDGGRLRDEYRLAPDLHLLSIRHLAVGPDGTVVAALQFEGPDAQPMPLVCVHRGEERLRLLHAPAPVAARMRNYAGSTTLDRAGRIAAVSAPRGNLVTFWDVVEGRYVAETDVPDGCGVAPAEGPGGFVISSGRSGIWRFDAGTGRKERLPSPFADALRWDNHLFATA